MKYHTIIASFLCLLLIGCNQTKVNNFVTVKNGAFFINETPYAYVGANYWQGMNLGAPQSGNRKQLCNDLDHMKANGITNLRILAATEADNETKYAIKPALQTAPGTYNEDIWLGLDFLLSEMGKRDMKAVVVLNNFWMWSGGFSQYIKWQTNEPIPYPQDEASWSDYGNYTKGFYSNKKALEWSTNHLKKVITRTNTISGTPYTEDATIMSWQLANEPEGYDNTNDFHKWINTTANLIKSLDKNHLVSTGSEGNTPNISTGNNVFNDHNFDNIDYVTFHIWAQNWGWYAPGDSQERYNEMLQKVDSYVQTHVTAATQLGKPIVLEEFGLARDAISYDPQSTTSIKDKYYAEIFDRVLHSISQNDALKGVNFWAYSGESRPTREGKYWQEGDEFLGDPPHELQGWYGVYNTDTTTIKIIKSYSDKISNHNIK